MSPAPENETDDPALSRAANGNAGSAVPADMLDVGSLIRAALLNAGDHLSLHGHDLAASADASGTSAYDGHVSLALDAEILPAIDATLDLLTTSTDLFDVPSFDFGQPAGDAGDA